MLVNIHHDTRGEHARLLVAGVAFLVAMALLVALSIAIYDKAFTDYTTVTIKAERAGLQLAKFGDVRRHGVLVGRVDAVDQDGEQASITVALEPDEARRIPQNVRVEILPTTLFGQKYIALVDPREPAAKTLRDGVVIPSSRVRTNVELSAILANLFPLLRAIRPADLNTTLHALATALSGRGEQIGRTLEDLDAYLTAMNPHLDTLRDDLRLLAKVSRTYSLAAPDLVRLLRNATTAAKTVTQMKDQLGGFIEGVTTLATTGRRVLADNESAIIRESQLAVPLLGLLDTYSPEIPCVMKGAARYADNLNQIFASGRVAQTMSFAAEQRPPYGPQDRPEYGEIGHGPWCLGLPYPQVPAPPLELDDGYRDGGE
jgi:phospholipid/cholesterol/gamma-HCH transport system substrate-binding protein